MENNNNNDFHILSTTHECDDCIVANKKDFCEECKKIQKKMCFDCGMGSILILDDSRTSRKLIEFIFSRFGNTVYSTGNYDEALKLANLHNPVIAFIDIMLDEDRTGVDFAKELSVVSPKTIRISYTASDKFSSSELFSLHIAKPTILAKMKNQIQFIVDDFFE